MGDLAFVCGPPVSPASSTGPQQTTHTEGGVVDGKETQEVVDEKFLELPLAACQAPASDSTNILQISSSSSVQ